VIQAVAKRSVKASSEPGNGNHQPTEASLVTKAKVWTAEEKAVGASSAEAHDHEEENSGVSKRMDFGTLYHQESTAHYEAIPGSAERLSPRRKHNEDFTDEVRDARTK
jgi:hypothetical protein